MGSSGSRKTHFPTEGGIFRPNCGHHFIRRLEAPIYVYQVTAVGNNKPRPDSVALLSQSATRSAAIHSAARCVLRRAGALKKGPRKLLRKIIFRNLPLIMVLNKIAGHWRRGGTAVVCMYTEPGVGSVWKSL